MLKQGTCLRIKRHTKDDTNSEFEIGSSLLLWLIIWVVIIVLLVRGFDPAALLRALVPAIRPATTGTLLNRCGVEATAQWHAQTTGAPQFSRFRMGSEIRGAHPDQIHSDM